MTFGKDIFDLFQGSNVAGWHEAMLHKASTKGGTMGVVLFYQFTNVIYLFIKLGLKWSLVL